MINKLKAGINTPATLHIDEQYDFTSKLYYLIDRDVNFMLRFSNVRRKSYTISGSRKKYIRKND